MLKTEYIEVLSVISNKLYTSAAKVMDTASKLIPANTFCIANLDSLSTKVLKSFNRDKIMLVEGLVVDNKESYCALVTEHAQGPLLIDNNLTHPLTRDMDATQFVGGCSFIGVPIRTAQGEFYGSLCSFDQNFYQYQERDVELLLSLSAFYTNLLQTTELSEEQTLYVDVIEKSGSNLLAMMDQILDYSKMEAGTMTLESSPFHIRDVVSHVVQLFSAEAEKKEIRLHAVYGNEHRDEPALLGDSNKISQILINLVGNALKFTEQGEVCLIVRTEAAAEDRVTFSIEVKDTCIGLPVEQKANLFRSFSQIHERRSPASYSGAGLGLSICKQLAELMNGKVWLRDTSEQGSTFAFAIPCSVAGLDKVQAGII